MIYGTPPGNFTNANLNALGSNYASQYGHPNSLLIQKIVRETIYDAAPKQFFDLILLGQKQSVEAPSDEFFYQEMGYQREPLQATATAAAASYPATQTISVASTNGISVNTIIVYPNNTKGNVTAVGSGTITVTPYTGGSVPAVAIGDLFANHSPVEADAQRDISQYFRSETIERFNYVQMFVKARRYGKMELFKYMKAGTTSDYLAKDKRELLRQFRTDLSNAFWNGERGEVKLANGTVAKTCGGIFPLMLAAGSPSTVTPVATLPAALEDIAFSTMFEEYGDTKFLYGTNRRLNDLSQAYKGALTRYTPDSMVARMNLNMISVGSVNIVLVPYDRFGSDASFPTAWKDRLFLINHDAITPRHCFGEEMGDTLGRQNNGTLDNYTDSWVSSTFSIEFNNPLSCGYIDIL